MSATQENTAFNPYYNHIQHLVVDESDMIIKSDLNLFDGWKVGLSIFDIHPFFEIIYAIRESVDKSGGIDVSLSHFPCVHITDETSKQKSAELVCDIRFQVDPTSSKLIHIILLNYTEGYKEINQISQERNESLIKLHDAEFTNKVLQEKEEFRNYFLENVNHELNTPLSSISGFIQLLERTELDYKQEEVVRIIKNESYYLKTIFKDILDLSKIDDGTFSLNEDLFDINSLINSVVNTFTPLIEERALNFEVTIDKKLGTDLYGDKTRIYQILNNLLNNALKYTEEGTISLSVKKIGGKSRKQMIEIEVKDTGIGIDEKQIQNIYKPFIQLNDKGEGAGLGLNIVKQLVLLMNGTIEVASKLGEGTTFTTQIYIKNTPLSVKKKVKKESSGIALKDYNKKFRALVVENKLSTQYLIMKFLLDQQCFYIDIVNNAEDALKNIENRSYDLLITDIKLKEKTGLVLAKNIRENYADDFIKNIPILAISAINQKNITNICVQHGIDAFLNKPFTREDFIEKITRLFKRRGII